MKPIKADPYIDPDMLPTRPEDYLSFDYSLLVIGILKRKEILELNLDQKGYEELHKIISSSAKLNTWFRNYYNLLPQLHIHLTLYEYGKIIRPKSIEERICDTDLDKERSMRKLKKHISDNKKYNSMTKVLTDLDNEMIFLREKIIPVCIIIARNKFGNKN
ncbi:hypothetical protein QTN25_010778 [Entamoeba marina]